MWQPLNIIRWSWRNIHFVRCVRNNGVIYVSSSKQSNYNEAACRLMLYSRREQSRPNPGSEVEEPSPQVNKSSIADADTVLGVVNVNGCN